MGEAKRRGTKEQRIAQSIERQAREAAERSAALKARRKAEAERISALPPQERKEAVLMAGGGGSHHTHMLLAAMSGLLAAPRVPVLVVDGHDDIGSR